MLLHAITTFRTFAFVKLKAPEPMMEDMYIYVLICNPGVQRRSLEHTQSPWFISESCINDRHAFLD